MPSPFTQTYVHLVWATWNRTPLITAEIEPRLFAAVAAKCIELKCVCVAVGGVQDHIHVLVRFAPKISISTLVGEIKGSTSHMINHEILAPESFRWQGSYGAFTVSRRSIPQVSTYILNQKEHHRDHKLIAEFEQCETETP